MSTVKPNKILAVVDSPSGSARWFCIFHNNKIHILTKTFWKGKKWNNGNAKNERKRVWIISDCQGSNPALIVKVQLSNHQRKYFLGVKYYWWVKPSQYLVCCAIFPYIKFHLRNLCWQGHVVLQKKQPSLSNNVNAIFLHLFTHRMKGIKSTHKISYLFCLSNIAQWLNCGSCGWEYHKVKMLARAAVSCSLCWHSERIQSPKNIRLFASLCFPAIW